MKKKEVGSIKPPFVRDNGRPVKLSPEIQKAIIEAVEMGNYPEVAAAYAGVNKSTMLDWLKRGAREIQKRSKKGYKRNKGEDKYVCFSNALSKAIAKSELLDVQAISNATEKYWQAAAWRLERKFSNRWALKQKIELETNDKAIQVEVDVGSKLREYAELVKKIQEGGKDNEG